ncbi:hypothetical protein [Xanthomonas sp. XNM01]|uniref:hypothetical protein n=1 Tax=Xanthomonas sp. XNM01 TaxID=2769289 RepID=UPI00177C4904|nr:hypothetical protein [Xanthomonas sp. XNM01]MBD9369235.1 hypothetical protein [Xanthomonas sp. XNM01]
MDINRKIPFFGVRRFARELLADLAAVSKDRDAMHGTLARIGGLTQLEREKALERLKAEISATSSAWKVQLAELGSERDQPLAQVAELRKDVVETRERALLQRVTGSVSLIWDDAA